MCRFLCFPFIVFIKRSFRGFASEKGGVKIQSKTIPNHMKMTAILNNSSSIILSHQHPSGDTMSSRKDIEVTKRLAEAGRLLGIEVLDHLMVNAEGEYTSLKEKGYL
jgi:DNA repair protein RadC